MVWDRVGRPAACKHVEWTDRQASGRSVGLLQQLSTDVGADTDSRRHLLSPNHLALAHRHPLLIATEARRGEAVIVLLWETARFRSLGRDGVVTTSTTTSS